MVSEFSLSFSLVHVRQFLIYQRSIDPEIARSVHQSLERSPYVIRGKLTYYFSLFHVHQFLIYQKCTSIFGKISQYTLRQINYIYLWDFIKLKAAISLCIQG